MTQWKTCAGLPEWRTRLLCRVVAEVRDAEAVEAWIRRAWKEDLAPVTADLMVEVASKRHKAVAERVYAEFISRNSSATSTLEAALRLLKGRQRQRGELQ